MAQANFEHSYHADPSPDEHVQDPGLTPVPPPEELADRYFMAAEFAEYLERGEYKKATSDAERASLAPAIAYTFIKDKIKRRAEEDDRFKMSPAVSYGTLHSVLHTYNDKYKPGTQLAAHLTQHREAFLNGYGGFAVQQSTHPEINGTLWLMEHAQGLGRADIEEAARVLLAAYGRSIEIVQESHIRTIDPYKEIS